ncbi:DUF448 domain-containing protein [Nitrosophilus alvini]|uniref:DUF448 domain-containing protein n=1 Tax=Nitrosophilus alvini TaxID=2714855 RepID=UPI001F1E419B|nr:DUF448 domain-containing protein [Nitrosophilus alvini]
MCIHCKKRFLQEELYRLQCSDKKIIQYIGTGRSFYICKDCIDSKNLGKSLARICKTDPASAIKSLYEVMLKEKIDNG